MGPGGIIEPYDPNYDQSRQRSVPRKAAHETRRRVTSASDVESLGQDDVGTPATARKKVFHSKITWSCMLILTVCSGATFRLHGLFWTGSSGRPVGLEEARGAVDSFHESEHLTNAGGESTVNNGESSVKYDAEPQAEIATPTSRQVETDSVEAASRRVEELDAAVRQTKQRGTVMETDAEALKLTADLQDATRKMLVMLYGQEPYLLKLDLEFPPSMVKADGDAATGTVIIEMAPGKLMPHAVYQFMKMASGWRGGAFHRNAGHVLQANVHGAYPSVAWQEYSPQFAHEKFTLGYAGRPGGPAFYISTIDNTRNHGPGSQGSATEADSCFAKVVQGFETVERMAKQMDTSGPNGFVLDESNHIRILALTRHSGPQAL
mmetsp:Transcript_8677/g.14935  ORF Transcript_8677/g.14935 Transcript_8677/m.14935 type:complete len:378 (-) Transcript_8677:184-1317(-)